MKETIRVAFFDIDGTLASHKVESSNFLDRVPASARRALCALRENGIQPVIVTGREPSVIRQFVADLEMDTYIAANGLSLTHGGVEVWRQLLAPEVVAALLCELREVRDVAVVLESTAGNVLCWNESPYTVDFDVSIEGVLEQACEYGVYQLAIIGDGLKGRVQTAQEGLKARVVAPLVLDILPEAVWCPKRLPSSGCSDCWGLTAHRPLPLAMRRMTWRCSAQWTTQWRWETLSTR